MIDLDRKRRELDRERREQSRRRDQAAATALKAMLTPQELADLAGPGTRTINGRPLRWRSRDLVHACEAAETVPDIVLAWTVCGRHDVPQPIASLVFQQEPVTCPVCMTALSSARESWPAHVFKARRRPPATSIAPSEPEDMTRWRRERDPE